MKSDCSEQRAPIWPVLLSVLAVNVGSLVAGYSMGYSSSALLDLADLPSEYAFQQGSAELPSEYASQQESAELPSEYAFQQGSTELSSEYAFQQGSAELPSEYAFQQGSLVYGLFAAMMPLGALVGSPIGGMVADWMSRKRSLMLSGIPNFAGWILIVFAQYSRNPVVFKGLLLVGRFITGIATGWMTSPITMYTSEISPQNLRGLFANFYQLSVIIGICLVYAVGAIPSVNYIHSAIVALGMIIVYVILAAVIFQSPRWLLSKANEKAAKRTLIWLRRSGELANQEVKDIMELIRNAPKLLFKEKLLEFRHKHVYKPLIIAEVAAFIYQFSGSNVVIFYAAVIFQRAEVDHAREIAFYSIGLVAFVATGLSAILVDKLGRKVLLIVGSIGIIVSCTGLGAHFFLTRPAICQQATLNLSNVTVSNETSSSMSFCNPHLSPLAICSLIIFSFAASLSWRSLAFVLMSELFPLHLRGILGGINDSTIWMLAAIVTGFYPEFERFARPYTAWWCFAFIAFLGLLFVAIFVPETKGKTLEEIEVYFRGRAGSCENKEKEATQVAQGSKFSLPLHLLY